MTYFTALLLSLSALLGGHTQAPSQPLSQAPSQAAQAPTYTVAQAQAWVDAEFEAEDMEQTPNVTILFTSESNCGAAISPTHEGGCTYTVAPNTYVITISPSLAFTAGGHHILFHELAHTFGYGECEAEAYAHQFEEVPMWSYPECEEAPQS